MRKGKVMDDNQRRDSNSKFIRSSDPDFYITNSKKTKNRNNDEAGRSRQQNAPSGKKAPAGKKKASGRKNSKPPYAGKKIPKSGLSE